MQKKQDKEVVTQEKTNDNQKEKNKVKSTTELSLLFFRWLFLAFSAVLMIIDPPSKNHGSIIIETFAVIVICEVLVSIYTINNFKAGKKNPVVLLYLDIVVLSVLDALNGGLESDIYIMLFFLIGYCGLFSGSADTVRITFFCIFSYSAAAFLAASDDISALNCWLLVIRDSLIVLAGFGISRINAEVKKYDNLRRREFMLARTDKLTGLANRHYFDQKLKEEAEYSDQTGNPINVLIFDLDNFKKFNDSYGHVWGDKLLTLFADIIRQSIRKSDIPVRYGGEEFLILIRDLDIVLATSVADRIRRQLEKQRIYIGDDEERKKVTVSCGVAQYPMHSSDIKSVIELADKALYSAKGTGKNKVVCYDEIA